MPASSLPMILAALFGFGLAFNGFVSYVEREYPEHGYTALWVVVGVAVTVLIAAPLIGWDAVQALALVFTASGIPMIGGSVARHLAERRRARLANENAIRQEANRGG